MKTITVEALVESDIDTVWELWTDPLHISEWNHASSEWECPYVENNVVTGGKLLFRMSAKDNSESFDLTGTYTEVIPKEFIAYTMEDGRKVSVTFTNTDTGIHITETFDPETINSDEKQRMGWQAILNNFKEYTETHL